MAKLITPTIAYRFNDPFGGPYHLLKKTVGRYHHTVCNRIISEEDRRNEEIRFLHPGQHCDVCLQNAGLIAIESEESSVYYPVGLEG